MTAHEYFFLVALGAVLFLDQWSAVQTMASRPIVAGALVGIILDAPVEGALWGAALEAMYLSVLPMGAARYPDVALAAIAGTAIALTGREEGLYPAGLAVALAIAAGYVGERVGRLQRGWNGRSAERVRERVAAGDLGAPGRTIAVSLARGAVLGALQTAVAVALGVGLLRGVGGTPWVGTLGTQAVAASALAAAAVAGARLFGSPGVAAEGWSRAAAWGAGVAIGAAIAWWTAAP